MSHVYSFMLIAFIIWKIPLFYKKPSLLKALFLGIVSGWIVLIRPTNTIVLLFVIFYNVSNVTEIKQRILWWLRNYKYILIAFLGMILIFSPQLLYWYEMTGNIIYYSYQGEGFPYWNKPKIAAVLFDSQNGLITYSPAVLLMLFGIIYSWTKKNSNSKVILIIFIISTYIFSSWWAWWFGGAFGHRSYVELYALLSIPLAFFINHVIYMKNKLSKYSIFVLIMFFNYYSVKLSIKHN